MFLRLFELPPATVPISSCSFWSAEDFFFFLAWREGDVLIMGCVEPAETCAANDVSFVVLWISVNIIFTIT